MKFNTFLHNIYASIHKYIKNIFFFDVIFLKLISFFLDIRSVRVALFTIHEAITFLYNQINFLILPSLHYLRFQFKEVSTFYLSKQFLFIYLKADKFIKH